MIRAAAFEKSSVKHASRHKVVCCPSDSKSQDLFNTTERLRCSEGVAKKWDSNANKLASRSDNRSEMETVGVTDAINSMLSG